MIHLEQVFDENVHTLRGQAVHAKVDKPGVETAKGVRVERAMPLWQDELGLVGKATSKRRRLVPVTVQLRADVVQTAQSVRQMLASGKLPPALAADQAAKRCKACSLLERCQPVAARANFAAARAALFDPDA